MTDVSKMAFPKAWDGQHGMTLREYYAGQALIGLLANRDTIKAFAREANRGAFPIEFKFAQESVRQAEALIAELAK